MRPKSSLWQPKLVTLTAPTCHIDYPWRPSVFFVNKDIRILASTPWLIFTAAWEANWGYQLSEICILKYWTPRYRALILAAILESWVYIQIHAFVSSHGIGKVPRYCRSTGRQLSYPTQHPLLKRHGCTDTQHLSLYRSDSHHIKRIFFLLSRSYHAFSPSVRRGKPECPDIADRPVNGVSLKRNTVDIWIGGIFRIKFHSIFTS